MATITSDFRCDLNEPVKVRYLGGNMFSLDNGGNTLNVYCYIGDEPAELGGSVTANVIRADGSTVAVSGAISGNKAYVILPQAAYAVPGLVQIIIKVTQNTTVTTVAAIVATVYQSSTDTIVDPGTIIPSVSALIAQIDTAINSIPADYSALLLMLAKNYSSSKTYVVGEYAWEAGVLKRCIVPITAGETYTAAHWTDACLGDDLTALKSALSDAVGELGTPNLFAGNVVPGKYLSATGAESSSADAAYTDYIPVTPGKYSIIWDNKATGSSWFLRVHSYNSSKEWIEQVYYIAVQSATERKQYDIDVPSGAAYIRISFFKYTYCRNIWVIRNDDGYGITAIDKAARNWLKNKQYNSADLLPEFATFTSRTSGGVEYTWNADNTECSAVGTSDALSVTNLYTGDNLPNGIIAGERYIIKCNTTDPNVLLELMIYNGSTMTDDLFIIEDTEITIPVGTTKIAMRIRTRYSSGSPSVVNATISVGFFTARTNRELEEDIAGIINRKEDFDFLRCFHHFCGIGDSLMAGFTSIDGITVNSATAKAAGNNWLNYLTVRLGRDCDNLAVGSSTTHNWRYGSQTGYPSTRLADADIEGVDCYFVGLGVNDMIHPDENTIGTSADIKADYTQNTDSVYGNLDFILHKLKEFNPYAKVFVFTIPWYGENDPTDVNAAIRHVCSVNDNAFCIDLTVNNPVTDFVKANFTASHFNPMVYNWFSKQIEFIVNKYIYENYTSFVWIPYEH